MNGGRGDTPGRHGERGAGSVLVVGVLGAVLAFTLALLGVAGAFVASQQAANAADAAALAAADVASGAVPGSACALAEAAASANRAQLGECELSGQVARVTVTRQWGLLTLRASARAGPPGSP